jgi:hypothetical protein
MDQCAHVDCQSEGSGDKHDKSNAGVLCDAHHRELVLSVHAMCAWSKEKSVAKYGTPVRMKGKKYGGDGWVTG